MNRTEALNSLINFTAPLQVVIDQLEKYPFDSEKTLVELHGAHITAVLHRFIIGELNATEVESWANVIECRDDIELVQNSRAWEAIHEIANPYLTEKLTMLRAQWWVSRLLTNAT